MNSYIATFTGRLRGAIGMNYDIKSPVLSETPLTGEEILFNLYDEYDHITNFSFVELTGINKKIMECSLEGHSDHIDVDRDIERKFGL